MRLTPDHEVFGPEARVRVFGSRLEAFVRKKHQGEADEAAVS
jgi:hypothetical protein